MRIHNLGLKALAVVGLLHSSLAHLATDDTENKQSVRHSKNVIGSPRSLPSFGPASYIHNGDRQESRNLRNILSPFEGIAIAGVSDDIEIVIHPDLPFMQRLLDHSPMQDIDSLMTFLDEEAEFHNVVADELLPTPSDERQVVYLDFNNAATYQVIINGGETLEVEGYTYNSEEQAAILERLQMDYSGFDIEFTTEVPPTSTEFSTVRFNDDAGEPIELTIVGGQLRSYSILFGVADGIDFLNVVRNDVGRVNGNFWGLLVLIDPSGSTLSTLSGIPIDGSVEQALSTATINQSANTGAHELAHNLGMRHHDAYGAPDDGLPNSGTPENEAFVPVYSGLRNATETLLHTMASGASAGLSLEGSANRDRFFSERSAIKLSLADGKGEIISEVEAMNASQVGKGINLPKFIIPNTIIVGENAGTETIETNMELITGRIDSFMEADRYRLSLRKGTYLNAEVISQSDYQVADPVITRLHLYREADNGTLLEIATNFQTFEPFDPLIVDVEITETGTYVVEVIAPNEIFCDQDGDGFFDDPVIIPESDARLVGDYWLLLYNFVEVPTLAPTPTPHTPIVGACCSPNGKCTLKKKRRCKRHGGKFQGNGSKCRKVVCNSFSAD